MSEQNKTLAQMLIMNMDQASKDAIMSAALVSLIETEIEKECTIIFAKEIKEIAQGMFTTAIIKETMEYVIREEETYRSMIQGAALDWLRRQKLTIDMSPATSKQMILPNEEEEDDDD